MKNMNKLLLATGLALGVLHGDAVPQAAPAAAVERADPVDLAAIAPAARKSIANRYDHCEVTEVQDAHIVKDRPDLVGQTRPGFTDEVRVSFKVHETDGAKYYEDLYKDDDRVMWEPQTPMGRVPVKGKHGDDSYGEYIAGPSVLTTQGNATEFTLPLYPSTDIKPGTRVGIFLNQEVDSPRGLDGGSEMPVNLKVEYCGSMVLGAEGWALDTQAPPMDDFYRESRY